MTNDMGRTVTKSVAIIGEGETEWFYFDSLRIACRYPFKVAPDFPQHSDIKHILKLVESYLNKQYDYIVCLFDMDRLFQFPSEMQLYQRAKKKYAARKYAGKVMFVETNPCTTSCLMWFVDDTIVTNSCFPNCRNICQDMKRQNDISYVPTSINT